MVELLPSKQIVPVRFWSGAPFGEMSERFKELVLKTSDPETGRGFESHSLRHPHLSMPCPFSSDRNETIQYWEYVSKVE